MGKSHILSSAHARTLTTIIINYKSRNDLHLYNNRQTGKEKMFLKLLVLLCILWTIHSPLSKAQVRGCPNYLDPSTITNLMATALAMGNPVLPQIRIIRYHTVCLSKTPENRSVNSLSVVVEYECRNHVVCTESRYKNGVVVEQFDFGCSRNGQEWSARQYYRSMFQNATFSIADFNTKLRTDCTACVGETVATYLHFEDLTGLDPITHCMGKEITLCAL